MNEDEAFIRAIVDSPGDDTSRLVYADWLDDRSDPRGTYLRAEREAVVTGDISRLKELAVGLDPVWVARVSLPPVGVCCDGLSWMERGELATREDVAQFEARFGITLPPAYRGFLLNYNGGVIELDPWHTPSGIEYRSSCEFHSLAKTMQDDPCRSLEYEFEFTRNSLFHETPRGDERYHVRAVDHMIIGRCPGFPAWVFLKFAGECPGRIRSLNIFSGLGAERPLEPVRFGSLQEYLAFLCDYRV